MWLRAGELSKKVHLKQGANATTDVGQPLSGTDIDDAARNVQAKLMDEKIGQVKRAGLRRGNTIRAALDIGFDHDEAVEVTRRGTVAASTAILGSAGSSNDSVPVPELGSVPEFESGTFQAFAQSVGRSLAQISQAQAELTLAVRRLEHKPPAA